MDGVVVQQSLAVTGSQARKQIPMEEKQGREPSLRPLDDKKVTWANRVRFRDNPECIPPAARRFRSWHDLTDSFHNCFVWNIQ